jgi:hypothetical protein
MFYEIPNGKLHEVPDNAFGFVYKCWIPPIGYGISSITGEVQETDILERPINDEDCLWVRPTLPSDYNSRRKKEKQIQKLDKEYIDPYLEQIRLVEWKRRIRGVWFHKYNQLTKKVELIYITGLQYLYCTYWKFQGKHMDYRTPDRDLFYVIFYCMLDPDCLGINELTKRKNGKTARLGCWIYERVSRMNNSHGGLQSKADDDAEEVFKKAIRDPWKVLPDFFRPRFDTMKGDSPNDELRFFATSRRGSKIEEEDDDTEEALNSWIDFKASSEGAYDGPELDTYGSDESGKTKKPVSIKERQNTVRYCSELDGVMKGKHYFTTTVEPEKGEEENYEFQEMTAASNPMERDDNNRTGTGLYTYFLPAQKGMMFDRYGDPDEKGATIFLNNTIKSYENRGDTRGLSSFKRKNPQNFKQAFSADGEFSLYDPELLNRQLDLISWTAGFTEFGDLEWEGGYRIKKPTIVDGVTVGYEPSTLKWIPNAKGRFEKLTKWFPKTPNKVVPNAYGYAPNNNHDIRIGCDPFRYDKTKDKRRSNCAAFAYQMPDEKYPTIFDDSFVLRYSYRADSTRAANEDILKMAWWCGCKVLFERNVNHWKNDFKDAECASFIEWLPNEVEPGIITAGGTIQTICNYTESHINEHISKVYFKTLIRKETGWLGFKVEDTEKFDEPMAAGITLINVKGRVYANAAPKYSLKEYFPNQDLWQYQ